MSKFHRGDHLVVKRGAVNHHGIYIGDDEVVHYSGRNMKCNVKRVSLSMFSGGNSVWVFDYDDIVNQFLLAFSSSTDIGGKLSLSTFPPNRIIARAESQEGENWYSIAENNCEHFAHWCVLGSSISTQFDGVKGMVKLGAFAAASLSGGLLQLPIQALTVYLASYKSEDIRERLALREKKYKKYLSELCLNDKWGCGRYS